MPDSLDAPSRQFNVRRAAFYFALVYFSQGVCQPVTLLNQPLRMYLQDVAHFNAEQIAQFYFVILIPWMTKPLYGLLSDFVPLFGYRRKSYLLLLNLLAAASFMASTGVGSADVLMLMLTLTGVGVAASDVVVDAMMVHAGRETGRTRLFQGLQWSSLNVAAIGSGIAGSYICARYAADAPAALRTALWIAACIPFIVAILTWLLVADQRAAINLPELRATARALLGAFKSRQLWLVVAFLFLIHFNPGVVTPMYDHLEHKVGLDHAYLAVLDTTSSAGMAAGALLFTLTMSGRMSTKRTVSIGLLVGAAGLLPLLFITDKRSAAIAYAIYGLTYMIASLSQLTVAAEACPPRVEAVVFAALMSVTNLSMSWCDVVGSKMYEGPLAHRIGPLIIASAALTAAGLLFVPFLHPVPREPQTGDSPTAAA
jgi:MFS family permease